MAKPRHDWYFNEWLAYYEKTQADVARDLDWNKAKASLFGSHDQRYHRDDVNALAAYLNLEPFELLLPPERAMGYRNLRASAKEIATDETLALDEFTLKRIEADKKPSRKKGTGTHG